ncbi:hypothetical protein GGR88_002723 [Sphingomonas jejuensis]|uniref:Uncharacterized protein n=1 Tax=Sphingomonas jejuensis TaxID=904715 RepID=A0ABX0XPM2_9SPHN|nr:hypothetical protein [Sphingomonas jejuensis]NJC35209.1 hypothetical protein [Sphingomonas jejuensis]
MTTLAVAGCSTADRRPVQTVGAAPVVTVASPLGTDLAPVKAEMPQGQHAYLNRLRCADGRAPRWNRRHNIGPGRDGHIIDLYDVDCGGAAPGQVEIRMDMYHPGHIETRAVAGFTLTAGAAVPTT